LLAPQCCFALALDDQPLDRPGQLVGVSNRPARAVGERLGYFLSVAVPDLVASLARDAELAAHTAHAFPVEQTGDEA